MIKVLFVCLGNICRSPMAEGHFKKLVQDNNLESQIYHDSAGTASYHVGELPDKRMRETAKKHGIILDHIVRQFNYTDFNKFDYILAMDSSNLNNILHEKEKSENPHAKVYLMRHFDKNKKDSDVPDPYYGDLNDYENVYKILEHSVTNFFEFIRNE